MYCHIAKGFIMSAKHQKANRTREKYPVLNAFVKTDFAHFDQ